MTELILKKGIKRTFVKLYNDIEQMPIERFNKMNKYWMLNDNIGSSISDFDKNHYGKLQLVVDDKVKLLKQLENFRILVYNIINEVNVNHLSFACLVYSINDKLVTDLTEENLKGVLKELSDLGLKEETLKKKIQKPENQSKTLLKRLFRVSSN